jgi:hypothetical protein
MLAPIVIGFVAVVTAGREPDRNVMWSFFFPWPAAILCLVVAGVLAKEAWFCLVIAAPFFLVLAGVGGLCGWAVLGMRAQRGPRLGVIALFTLLPYLLAPYEAGLPVQSTTRQVHSSVVIAATPALVWSQVTNLAPIGPKERPLALFHIMGLPRPVQARMACAAVGCVRRGEWEDGLAFDGIITVFHPGREYWVRLNADTSRLRPSRAPLAEVGGAMFGMLDDGYRLEPTADGHTILHLYSSYRLTTRMNGYAALWLDFLLQDIQRHILTIEQQRSEAAAALARTGDPSHGP